MTLLRRKLLAEFTGTVFLLAAVVGSGIMGAELSGGNNGIALLANAAATAAMLYVLVELFAPLSGAHFNPAVTLGFAMQRKIEPSEAAAYVGAQLAGAFAGVIAAHAMFDQPLVQVGVQARFGPAQWLSEGVATFGLMLTIALGTARRTRAMAALIACYIFAAYWFTASTSFANPAVTLARSITASFSGIRPADVAGFVAAQLVGALIAVRVSACFVTRRE